LNRIFLFAWGVALAPLACAQEIVRLETRPGVTQSFFVPPMRKPQAVALLYAGGNGSIRLRMEEDGPKFTSANFLPRSRNAFIRNGVLPVLMDAPSDRADGMSDEFRRSSEHAADARAAIAEMRRRHPGLPVFLVGTSRSTISIANLAAVLDRDIAGVVFSSTLLRGVGFNWPSIRVPALFVHHFYDACPATRYEEAQRLSGRYAFPLISVKGGAPAKAGPCQSLSAHGFYGAEADTVKAIAAWMLGRDFPRDIE
jgi:hypothetical protein